MKDIYNCNRMIAEAYEDMKGNVEGTDVPEDELFGDGMKKPRNSASVPWRPFDKVSDDGHWVVSAVDGDGVPLKADSANGASGNAFAEFTSRRKLGGYCAELMRKDVPFVIREIGDDGEEREVGLRDVVRASGLRDRYLKRFPTADRVDEDFDFDGPSTVAYMVRMKLADGNVQTHDFTDRRWMLSYIGEWLTRGGSNAVKKVMIDVSEEHTDANF